jgi:enoyl-CoA hydratase
MSNYLIAERRADGLVIRFTRPEMRNPLSVAVLEELHSIVDQVGGDNDIRKIIFTGTDNVFASGADLREISSITPDTASEFALYGQSLMTKISQMPQTSIAAINGFCFGGALDLALACTSRIASPHAKFAHPGTGLGIITGWGGTQRLPRLIGQARALEMFFTAEAIDAEAALGFGLIDEVADDPLAAALVTRTHDPLLT